MNALLAFAAALVSLRLAAELARRARARPVAGAHRVGGVARLRTRSQRRALAAGAAGGWHDATFRVYYLFGGLLTAPLFGIGSLLRVRAALGGSDRASLRRTRDRRRSRGAADADGSRHRDPERAGSPRSLSGARARDRRQLARHARRRRRRARDLPPPPARKRADSRGIGVAAAGSALSGLGEAGTAAFFAAAAGAALRGRRHGR